jgi:hypothetical protein
LEYSVPEVPASPPGSSLANFAIRTALLGLIAVVPGSLLVICLGSHLIATPLGLVAMTCGIISIRRARKAAVDPPTRSWVAIGLGAIPPVVLAVLYVVWHIDGWI